jgi:predicted transcriptional regulator
MQQLDITALRRIGLTDGELKIYSALLHSGETTRTHLAKASGISPSKIYDVANRLLEKGIISAVKKNGVLHFSAAPPERLQSFLEQKEQELVSERQLVQQLMPMLVQQYAMTKTSLDVEVFYDWDGMETVYDDIVKTLGKGDESCVFGASEGENVPRSDQFFERYLRKVEKKGFRIRIIYNESLRGQPRIDLVTNSKIHKHRYLFQETFTEFNVYKDTLLIIMLLRKPTVIRIRNKEAAASCRKFFETLWKQAKP